LRNKAFISLLLIAVTLAVFWQVGGHEFVNFDDDIYVTENRYVQAGLTGDGVIWAFTATLEANWHPLTWLSHMLDYQLYGLNPKGHHLTNLLFHLVNVLLLFLVLARMTGALWRSALVAALFSLHPLHVESVAWVAERKDVLSTFFWILTMWAYVRQVERPALNRYLLTLFFFALGLMAKPMLVTLPFVLLLLDYWPLERFGIGQLDTDTRATASAPSTFKEQTFPIFRLFWEKAPFFVLATASSVVTFVVQQQGGTVKAVEVFPVKIRIANAMFSYVSYMGKMIWPQGLAVFYPHPGNSLPMWQAAGAGLLLLGITILVLRAARRHQYLLVGWLWYLGTLVPVIGLVQVGDQAMADRYTYVPLIGLFIIISWGVPELLAKWRHRAIVVPIVTAAVLIVLVSFTWRQLQHWQDSISLLQHTLNVTKNNALAHNNLGNTLVQQGKIDEAITHFVSALRIKPDSSNAHNNLGIALLELGNIEGAIAHFTETLRLQPDLAETHNNLGVALFKQGRLDEAVAHYLSAVRLKPDYEEAYNNLGNALALQGKLDGAAAQYAKALEIRANYPEAHNNLGVALARQGKLKEAIMQFREALRLKPDYGQARVNLKIALEQAGNTSGDAKVSP